ncbi:GntR family transcriptional regulator [Acuticoccus sp. MNP-M23]|uniref:GntR family transcriptional regulator n=1 Tax=Acuticoccus sp. MNP-M23 TaxID=3072793 RepID=UPI002815DAD5|nr:GntR family transcriptional regulator [Acuticoccus sp. MNP-M23]WMS44522.1 GntR family transcriptional regulator [Acuticoccus sp. MNP-M23]
MKKQSASVERVAEVLRDRIVKGALPAGARLKERALSLELSVSRTPIREALKLLQSDGLVEISLNKGAQVVGYGAREAVDLFELIAVLEALAAERIAARMDTATLARLETLHGRMLRRYEAGDAIAYFDINTEIHDTIVAASSNPELIDSHKRVVARARRGRFLAIMDAERWAEAVGEHEAVMRAFRRRDSEAAARVWRMHLDNTGATVSTALDGVASGVALKPEPPAVEAEPAPLAKL